MRFLLEADADHADPSPTHFSTLDQQWSHDSQSFPRSIPDSTRVLVAHADGAAPHRTALQALRGPSEEGQDKTRPARHDLVSDVEAHVDDLASLALVVTNRPLTHCSAVPAVDFFPLHFILF